MITLRFDRGALFIEDDQGKESTHRHANDYARVLAELKESGVEYRDNPSKRLL